MDFSWSEEALALKDDIIKFAREALKDDVIENDKKGIFSLENWKKCADFGILGLATPKAYGGREEKVDLLLAMLAMESFGYACPDNGLAFALNAQMWTVQYPIVTFGSPEQKAKFLPNLTNGTFIGGQALTEPGHGSDVFGMKTTATKCEGGYLLNGHKTYIGLAPVADVSVVYASTNPKYGKWGISAFLVEKGSEGYSAPPAMDKMGLRTIPTGELIFDNYFVPEENLLGKEGSGFSIINHSLEYDRCTIFSSQLGAMERQLEQTIQYAKTREQFGQAIGKFQSVSNRLADMKLRIETSKLLLYKTAWLLKQGKPALLDAALLKLYLSESFVESSLDAIRIHGGNGYMTDNGVERNLRDAVGGVIYAGTSDIQRNIIAKFLGL